MYTPHICATFALSSLLRRCLFVCVLSGAAAAGIPPALLEQLKPGGRLVIPVGPEGGDQRLEVLDKEESGQITKRVVTGVRYVPLTSEQHQLGQA